MSKNEQVKYSVIEDFLRKKITRKDAATTLSVAEKSITRMAKKVKREGIAGIKHGNTGRSPINKTNQLILEQALKLYEKNYYDMNVTHALEHIRNNQNFKNLKYETFRKKLKSKGLIKRKKRRLTVKRTLRTRSPSEGYILQMDGSHHLWNRKDEWCLIAAIDDATSDIPYAEFFKSENTINCMKVMQRIIEIKGIPFAIYVDKAGWFGGLKRQLFCEFKRACEELGIKVIFANSPQAKGRIERAWDTFQDRIIPEMRIRNIHSIESANSYLQNDFIPGYWRLNNTVAAKELETRYRKLPESINLNEIFCFKEYRQVKGDHTISFEGSTYRVITDMKYSIQKRDIEIRTYQDISIKAFFAGKEIHLEKVEAKTFKKTG